MALRLKTLGNIILTTFKVLFEPQTAICDRDLTSHSRQFVTLKRRYRRRKIVHLGAIR